MLWLKSLFWTKEKNHEKQNKFYPEWGMVLCLWIYQWIWRANKKRNSWLYFEYIVFHSEEIQSIKQRDRVGVRVRNRRVNFSISELFLSFCFYLHIFIQWSGIFFSQLHKNVVVLLLLMLFRIICRLILFIEPLYLPAECLMHVPCTAI